MYKEQANTLKESNKYNSDSLLQITKFVGYVRKFHIPPNSAEEAVKVFLSSLRKPNFDWPPDPEFEARDLSF